MPLARGTTLLPTEWRPLAEAHAARVDAATAGYRERASGGEKHAVDDFLYDYYATRPSLLRRWHPGAGVTLVDAPQHKGWRWYRSDGRETRVDEGEFMKARGDTVRFVSGLLEATASRAAALGCFGLHEWAMVYRLSSDDRRHPLPLRLGAEATDAVVEDHQIQCTHFDAFRFFAPDASALNRERLTRENQPTHEQPGCLHPTMDLYKWCAKLSPAVPAELQQEAFELAVEVRRVDMQASPYDVSGFGLTAITIETPEGKREFSARQRDFAARGGALRSRLLAECVALINGDEVRGG